MRRGGLGGLLGTAGFNHDDGFVQRYFSRGGEKRARVADRFHVDHDAARVRIVAQVIDQIAPTYVEHRTGRDEGAEADLLTQAPVENGGTHRAALADEGERAG